MSIYAVVIAGLWQGTGLVMALMLAGLRGIDDEIWHRYTRCSECSNESHRTKSINILVTFVAIGTNYLRTFGS
jgi:hypothetical protein